MAILRIADKPTLDDINLKVDNLKKKLDYEAQTIRTLVGYRYVADDNAVVYSLQHEAVELEAGSAGGSSSVNGSITIDYDGEVVVKANLKGSNGNAYTTKLLVSSSGGTSTTLTSNSSSSYNTVSNTMIVKAGDVLTFTVSQSTSFAGYHLQANSIKICATTEPVYEYETVTECSKVGAVKTIQRGNVTTGSNDTSITIATVAPDRCSVHITDNGSAGARIIALNSTSLVLKGNSGTAVSWEIVEYY